MGIGDMGEWDMKEWDMGDWSYGDWGYGGVGHGEWDVGERSLEECTGLRQERPLVLAVHRPVSGAQVQAAL